MTLTSIQMSFHRTETGLHHVPSSPQFLNSSRVKHYSFLIILFKWFCESRHSEENIHFLLSEEHPEQKWWTLSASLGICYVIIVSDENIFTHLLQLYHTQFSSPSVHHLGSKSSRYEPNRERRAVNKLSLALAQITARFCVRLSVGKTSQQPVRTSRSFYKFSYS